MAVDQDQEERGNAYDDDWKAKTIDVGKHEDEAAAEPPSSDETTDTNDSSGLGAEQLKSAEEDGGLSTAKAGDDSLNYRDEGEAPKRKGSRRAIAIGAGGGGALFLGIMLLMLLLGSIKGIHFATVMRNAGFATTQFVMRKEYAQIGYENAVLSEDSVGRLTPPERTMFDRVRGINAQKTLDMLGEEGEFKVFQDKSGVQGFDLRGKRYNLDDFAGKFTDGNGNPKTYDSLSPREKLTVKNDIVSTLGDEMADVFKAEPRSFRNGFFKGFREHFDISTSKWVQKARELAGKSPNEAESKLRSETVDEISKGSKVDSSLPPVEEGAQAVDEEVKADVAQNLRQRSQQWVDNGLKKAGFNDGITGFEDSLSKASAGVLVATTYCMIHDANSSLHEANPQREQRAQRYAHDVQTTAEQAQAHDVNAEAVGASDSLWDGSANVPPANSSALYLQSTYKSQDGFDQGSAQNLPRAYTDAGTLEQAVNIIDSSVKLAMGPARFIPGASDAVLDNACAAIMNPATQVGIVGLELTGAILTGGGSGAGEEGFVQATKAALLEMGGELLSTKSVAIGGFFIGLQSGLQILVNLHASTAFSGAETGADRYNTGAIATNYQNAAVGRGVSYGRPLSKEESKTTTKLAMASNKEMYQSKPFKERYFALSNPYSLVGSMAAIAPSSLTGLVSSIRLNISHIGSTLGYLVTGGGGLKMGLTAAGLGQKAYAANSDDIMADNDYFGIRQWGWSAEEISRIDGDPAFDTIANGGWVEQRNVGGALDNKYSPCYTPDAQTDVPENCYDSGFLSSDEALHWRLYKLHTSIITQLGDNVVAADDSAQQAPANSESGIVGDLAKSSVDVPCSSTTKDAGIADGYSDGNLVKIRLCALPNLPSTGEESTPGSSFYVQGANGLALVNSRVSATVFNMVNAAKAAGIPMGADSTFRTMAHQQNLCGGTCDGSLVARPGHSNHQMGLAIDFKGTHKTGSSSTSCSGRARDPSSPVWSWLLKNAGQYGYKQYTNESWHWDPVDSPSRCGPTQ